MAAKQYRVTERSFVDNRIVEEGAVIEYDGEAGPNLEPVKGKKATEEAPAPPAAGEETPALA